jgi:hypothetical protein
MKEEMKEGTSVLTTAAQKCRMLNADAKYAERGKKALDDLTKVWMHGWGIC